MNNLRIAELAVCLFALTSLLTTTAQSQGAEVLFSGSTPLLSTDDQAQAILDLDHDGDDDILSWWWMRDEAGDVEPRVMVKALSVNLEGSVDVTWNFPTQLGAVPSCVSAGTAIGDFDGDGFDDFAIAMSGFVQVYATRKGELPDLLDRFPMNVRTMRSGDINGDGLDDLILVDWGENTSAMLSSGTAGPLVFAGIVDTNNNQEFGGLRLTILDYYQDGADDVVLIPDSRDWLAVLSMEAGVFKMTRSINLSGNLQNANSIVAGDVDGDGDVDLTLFDPVDLLSPGRYWVYRCDGPADYTFLPMRIGGPATHLMDIDQDGDLDGLCCGGGSGCNTGNNDDVHFQVSLNDGNGFFDVAITVPSISTGRDGLAGLIDMDGDGDLDMVGGRRFMTNHLMLGSPYCTPNPNSTGAVGDLYFTGSASYLRSDLQLHAGNITPNKISMVLIGNDAAEIPLGNSLLCIGSSITRYAITTSNDFGRFQMAVPTQSLPSPGSMEPGDTRRFQIWHRESAAAGGFAFSEAVRIMFAP